MILNIDLEITRSIKNQDSGNTRLTVLRALKTELINASLRKGNVNTELTDAEVLGVIRKKIASGKDSITQFTNGNRPELALKEKLKVAILESFLPQQLEDCEIVEIINRVITEENATGRKHVGIVIKKVLEIADGHADPKTVSVKILEILK